MKAVTYTSSDGLKIPAYLTLPVGVPAKGLPAIVLPHGGPWGRDQWGYSGLPQFYANRGYAVLQMNFRGSTGYGKKFLNAGNKQWGQLMQDDITWGVKYLIAEGIADPEAHRDYRRVVRRLRDAGRRGLHTGSLRGCRVDRRAVEPHHPARLDSPYWEAARKIFFVRLGDPTTPGGPEAPRAAVTAELGVEDHGRRCWWRRAPTIRA